LANSGWRGNLPRTTTEPAWDTYSEKEGALIQPGIPLQSGSAAATSSTDVTLPGTHLPILRLVGQIGATYLVAEGPDGLYLVDQHAAHERVLFEKYLKMLGGPIPSQALLQPVVIQLSPASSQALTEKLPVMADLGFQIDPFGPDTFRVVALPALLSAKDPASAVRVVIEDFEEDETPLESEIESRLAARICKRVAVKAGQILSPEEQKGLLQDLESCQYPRTCPHGRPTMIHLSVDLLEQQFGRRGSR
jgi:DNA mismatch repair protein MutL